MASENEFLLHAFLMGAYVTFVYDFFRILRRVIPHGNFWVSLEDICFWLYCAVKVFLLMYRESNGTLRWFAVLGALAGMLLYRRLVSPYFVKFTALALRKIFCALGKAVGFFFRPLLRFWGRLRSAAAHAADRYAVKRRKNRELRQRVPKKKLTYLRKLIKIKNRKQL